MPHPHAQDSPDRDFFISYARADARWAEWIVDTLDAAGFEVAFDLRDLPAGRSSAQWMDGAIARCERILAVVSPHYFDSQSYVGAEWPTAFSDWRRWDGRIVPVVVQECEAELSEHPLLGHLTPLRLIGLTEGRAKEELITRLESSRTARYPGFSEGRRSNQGSPDTQIERRRSECFTLGPLRTTWRLVEGDGQEPIPRENVRVVVTPEFIELPQEMLAWREEIEAEQAERRSRGLHALWNGKSYAVEGLSISRTVNEEAPEVCLRLQHADYYAFLTTQQLDRPFEDGTTPRSRYLSSEDPEDAPAFMSCSFGVNVAVVTHDHQLVFSRRSVRVGSLPGLWSSSANEALSRDLDSRGRTPPDLYDVAKRGLAEELNIQPDEYRLRLLCFGIDVELQQWGACFIAELTRLSATQLRERRTQGVPDRWEHDYHEYVPFDVDAVISHLLREDRRDTWTPTAPPLFYLALINRYGKRAVQRRTAALLRKLDVNRLSFPPPGGDDERERT
jgi:hypothetical protein